MSVHAPGARALEDEFELGEWRVRLAEGALSHPDGRAARLEPRVAAVLGYFVRHPDRLVSQQELLSNVWPDVVVAPVALSRAISELRRALADDPKAPRYIETLPKRGYRLLLAPREASPVQALPAPPDAIQRPLPNPDPGPGPLPAPARRVSRALGHRTLASVCALLVICASMLTIGSRLAPAHSHSGVPAVVVQPFDSFDAETARFAAGLTEDLLAQLSRVDGIRILASEPGARRSLVSMEASHELRGSVRRDARKVRVVARLIAVESGDQVWSQDFDRTLGEVLLAQRDVALRITHALQTRLIDLRTRSLAGLPAAPPSPYDLYRRGRALLDAGGDLKAAVTAAGLFEQALLLSPEFTLGRAGLADALSAQAGARADRALAHRALELAQISAAADPDLPEAQQALARSHMVLRQWSRALAPIERALELRPDYPHALINRGVILGHQGELDRSIRAHLLATLGYLTPRVNLGFDLLHLGLQDAARDWFEYALEGDAEHAPTHVGLAKLDILESRPEAARERLTRMVALTPACQSCFHILGALALMQGDASEARRQAERALELPGDPGPSRLLLAASHLRAGKVALAEPLLGKVTADAEAAIADGSEWWLHRWNLAAAAGLRQDAATASTWYLRAVDTGRRFQAGDRVDPLFEAVRDDPRFVAALERAKQLNVVMQQRLGAVPLPPGSAR